MSNQPIRLSAGAFVLSAGFRGLNSDGELAKGLHDKAKASFPVLENVSSEQFAQGLAVTEIALGGALVIPFVPDRLAGLVLTPFAAALLWMNRPSTEAHPDALGPSRSWSPMVRDVWLLGIGLTLLTAAQRAQRTLREA